ncbi:hypothetical protein [Terriglobus sp. ADX1]|uniref:hypothetical protein n=1 Tax=Terriglobus sp. ADX1 TaxID=2794063 RepID=UPI002FE5FF1F
MKLSRGICVVCFLALCASACAQQEDGGVSYFGRGQEVLESIYVPNVKGAPFSLQLATEWTRPLLSGGTMTAVNSRPIKRDSEGRIYMERWLLVPKGTNARSQMSWIQIDDPVANLYYECNARTRVCTSGPHEDAPPLKEPPSMTKSGPVSGGRAYRQHEDLGADTVKGVPVHAYRDTVTVQAGAMGNSQTMTYYREMKYSAQLGFNLISIVQSPSLGEQRFVTTEITTSEPEAKWFRPPEGYSVVAKKQAQ